MASMVQPRKMLNEPTSMDREMTFNVGLNFIDGLVRRHRDFQSGTVMKEWLCIGTILPAVNVETPTKITGTAQQALVLRQR